MHLFPWELFRCHTKHFFSSKMSKLFFFFLKCRKKEILCLKTWKYFMHQWFYFLNDTFSRPFDGETNRDSDIHTLRDFYAIIFNLIGGTLCFYTLNILCFNSPRTTKNSKIHNSVFLLKSSMSNSYMLL